MNLTRTTLTPLAAGLLILGSVGCGNPADNVPAAAVSDATTTPASVETTGQAFMIGEGSAISEACVNQRVGTSGSTILGTGGGSIPSGRSIS